jgi:hypothetical protein
MLRRYYGKISKLPINEFFGHDGELVVDDITGKVYVMDGVTLGGTELVGAMPKYGISPPTNPTPGTLWYDPVSGRTYIYFQDTWVDAAPNTTYTLPIASTNVLGGIKVGLGLSIDNNGVVTANSHTPSELINGSNIVELGNDGALTVSGKITTPSVSGSGVVGENLYIGAGAVSGSNATSGSTIIQGGHGDPGTGGSGPVQIQTGSDVGNPNFKYTWNFDGQGRLTLPGAYATGGTLMSPSGFSLLNTDTFQFPRLDTASIIVPPNGSNDPIQIINDGSEGIRLTTPRGTVLFGNQPEDCVTQSSHFHIMKQDPGEVDLFFGDDYNYLKLPQEGNVAISANGPTWNFNSDGILSLPGEGNITSISGNISIKSNVNALSFHATSGIANGSGFLFRDSEESGYTSGMRHANISNQLQLVHQSNIGLLIEPNGEVTFGNIRVFGNVNSFVNFQKGINVVRGITSNSYSALDGITNGYRFNYTPVGESPTPLPTAIIHNDFTNQIQLIHEYGNVSLNANGTFQTSNIIINGTNVSTVGGTLYVNGHPISSSVSTVTSSSPPAHPVSGQLWYDTNSGKIYVYLTDSWVDTSLSVASDRLVSGSSEAVLARDGALILENLIEWPQSDGGLQAGSSAWIFRTDGHLETPAGYILPNTMGSPGQVMVAGGQGSISWQNQTTGSTYSNSNVSAYLTTNSTITSLISNSINQASNITALYGNASSQASAINVLRANANTQAVSINLLIANSITQATAINTLTANVSTLISNSNVQAIAIDTLISNVATLNANAVTQAVAINTLTAKINAANVHIASMSAYSNANVGAYLTTYIGTIGGSITVGDILKAPQHTKTSSATGSVGQICWDSNYIYVCTATNTWKRVALTGGY